MPAVRNLIAVLEKNDVEKNKSVILQNYGYLVYIHANVQKDYPAAIKDLEGILAVDSENTYAKGTIEQIRKVMNGPTKTTSKPKPKSK